MDSFKEGMIVRIFCEDFLTYNSIECFPCAKLNMIVGPNGTGKSSLVNAIVLGLGGKTSVIGRAKQLSAYVKRGCRTAKIEIELYSEPNNYIIGRTFSIDNKNQWSINGQLTTFKQVESVIEKLNIQIDNLCQFLPQDRVQDFAKMDSKQLLENTLKTVGSTEIVDLHTSLKELRTQEVNFDSETKLFKKRLESEKKKIAGLEAEVKAIKEREEILEKIRTLEKKKGWVEFDAAEKQRKSIFDDRTKILNLKKTAEEHLKPFKDEMEEAKTCIKTLNRKIDLEIRNSCENSSMIKRKHGSVEKVADKIEGIESEVKRKIESIQKKAERVHALELEINQLEAMVDLEKEQQLSRNISDKATALSRKGTEVHAIESKKKDIEEEISEVNRNKNRTEGAIDREMSAANQKKQILAQRFADSYRAYQWLQENRHEFQGQIYGPIMLEINCNEQVAKFVEFMIPNRDLTAFVCENKNDMNKLMRTVRDQMKLRINVVQAPANHDRPVHQNYPPPIPLQSIKQFGFWTYVIDQVEGPDAVLNYLSKNYGLHRTPLGNRLTGTLVDQIPQSISSYFSDTQHFFVKVSKYSGQKSSRIVGVKASSLLCGSTNTSALAEYKKILERDLRTLEALRGNLETTNSQISLAERQRDNLRQEKKKLDEELMTLRHARGRLRARSADLVAMRKEIDMDPEAEEMAAKQKISKLVLELCQDQKANPRILKNYQNSIVQNEILKKKLSCTQEILRKKQQESMEATRRVEQAQTMLTNVEEDLRKVQVVFKRAEQNALTLTNGLRPKDPAFKRLYEEAFAVLPEEVETIDIELGNLTARAGFLAGGREHVQAEYEKTKNNITKLESTVNSSDARLQFLKDEMNLKRAEWLPQVIALIKRINANFTKFFSLMGCVGEVSLESPEIQNEYSKYGICIKVQFRQSSRLQQLGPHTQSGGERAVATAIYMLSLQELTTVPFRCVDEINQGMDENNERVVFRLMVSTVGKSNSAQCFLLTPKVLQTLDYSEYVKVLCIYSGGMSVSHMEFNVKRFVDKIHRQSGEFKRMSLKRRLSDSESSD